MSSELDTAYAYCERITREEARNFFYAFRTLPAIKRRSIYAAYAFARTCDDAADEDLPVDEKLTKLAEIRGQVALCEAGRPHSPVMIALADTAARFVIPYNYFYEVLEGVKMDLVWTRYKNFDELRKYCYKVASIIGLISIQIFDYKDEQNAKKYAVGLGLAMQLTNILRDIREDAERGRIYIPLDEIKQFGYSEAELLNGTVNDPFKKLMAFQAQRAHGYFDTGLQLLPLVARDSRACPAVLGEVYKRLLEHIEDSGFAVFETRISLSKIEKLTIMLKFWIRQFMPRILMSDG